MNMPPERFDIDQYTKPGFDIVIALDYEVEYILDKEAIESIKNNELTTILKRLIDGEVRIIVIEQIIKSLQVGGPVDYIKIDQS